jgi:DNA repair exonuclease SbcCD ATPase subunit/DNA repair exonuclease SbcCD nuclease subunit/intein/homing endonuclease
MPNMGPMRIVITADTHLDESNRWDEQLRLLDWLVGDIAEREPALICHAGDLFERRPSRGERAMAADWFRRLADISPVLAVNGNHSGPEYLAPLNSSFPREKLAELLGWAPSMSSPVAGRFPVTVESGADVHVIAGCAVACLSWPSRAALLAATNLSNGWAQQVGHHDMQNVLRHLGATLESHPGPRILISHATVTGARTQTGFEALGTDFEISLSDLSLAHADAMILGHIHDAELNRWDIDGAPVTYCGSSRHCNWGERGNCYYVVVDIPDDRSGPATVEYVRVPATPMVDLEAEWTPDGWASIPEGTVAGAEVRLRYKVAIEQREVAAKAAAEVANELVNRYGAVSVKLEPITKVVTRARAPDVGTAREVPDKLQALWKHQHSTPEPEITARLLSRLDVLRASMDDEYRGKASGAVIPQRVVLHEVGPYHHVEVDLAAIAGPIVATIGDPGAGKCLPGSTIVYSTDAGELSLSDVVRQRVASIIGYTQMSVVSVPIVDWHILGERDLVELRVAGWPFRVAGTHPVLTQKGWIESRAVTIGDHVAVPRHLPIDGDLDSTDDELRLAGYMIADGSMVDPGDVTLGMFVRVRQRQVPILLGALWTADGYVSVTGRETSYCTASIVLAKQVRDLLLRIGVLASLHRKTINGTTYYSVTLIESTKPTFNVVVGPHIVGPKARRLRSSLSNSNVDTLPFEVWSRHITKSRRSKNAWNRRQGISRKRFVALGGPITVASEPIWWAPVTSVEPAGVEECFDITVATPEHAYVADAVVSHNSTLWEHGILGAIDRTTVNSGSLKDRARSRDSYIETTFLVGGKPMVIKQSHDNHTDKGTSEVLVDGKPILSAAGIKEYKAWRQEALPSTAVLKASLFSFQRINQDPKSQGAFLGLTDADRVSVILEATGCGYLEEMAKGARERSRESSAALDLATQRLADERSRGGSVEAAEAGVSRALGDRDQAQETLDLARVALAAGEEELRAYAAAQDAFLAAVAERGKLEAQVRERGAELLRLDVAIGEANALVSQADAIRGAVARGNVLTSELTKIGETRARLLAEQAAATAALASLERQSGDAEESGKQWRARLDSANAQLARKGEIAEAKNSIPSLEEAVAQAAEAVRSLEAERVAQEERMREMAGLEAQVKADARLIGTSQYRMEQAQETLKRKGEVESAAVSLEALRAKVVELEANLEAARGEEAELTTRRVAGSEERIGGLREGLRSIAWGVGEADTPEGRAADTLANDDGAIRDSVELPKAIEQVGAKIGKIHENLRVSRLELEKAERLAARADEMETAAASLVSAKAEFEEAQKRYNDARKRIGEKKGKELLAGAQERLAHADLDWARSKLATAREVAALGEAMAAAEAELSAATDQVDVFRAKWVEIRTRRTEKQAEIATIEANLVTLGEQENAAELEVCSLADLIAKAEPLATAEGTVATCHAQRTTVLDAIARLEGELKATLVPQEPEKPTVDLSARRVAVLSAEGTVAEFNAALGRAQHALDQERESAERVVGLSADVEQLSIDLSDWNRLAKDLGRQGVQALEIDCAGPELTTWANKYLECWGPRFRVAIDTQRAHSSEDRMIEQCAVTVLDSREGTAREGRTFSGGETAILSRAMSLALASMACDRAGMVDSVLFEDEASGSLSEPYCEVYLAMLRKAIQLTRASKVVTISHQSTIHEGADSRILVRYDESSHESSVQIAA